MEEFKTPSRQEVNASFQSDKLMRNGLILIICSTLFFAICGAIAGWAMGMFAPDYYEVTLHFEEGEAKPEQVGAGLGLRQGAIGGLIAGCLVVVSTAWYKSRIKNIVLGKVENDTNSDS